MYTIGHCKYTKKKKKRASFLQKKMKIEKPAVTPGLFSIFDFWEVTLFTRYGLAFYENVLGTFSDSFRT